MDKYRAGESGEAGAAPVVVGLTAAGAAKESVFRDNMIRVAHRAGVSIHQLADLTGLGRKAVTAMVTCDAQLQPRLGTSLIATHRAKPLEEWPRDHQDPDIGPHRR